MPRSFLGIGTSYIGRKNTVIEPGLCEHCGRVGDMYTFDTTECFTFLYIPLAPLGKRGIIKECPQCGHHLVKKYQRSLGNFQTIAGIIVLYLLLLVLILVSSYRLYKHRPVSFRNGLQCPEKYMSHAGRRRKFPPHFRRSIQEKDRASDYRYLL
ncbi:MAG TPA: hypothetical protein GXZ36_02110 [Firmicutes bacterium]|nr:hypothetical protein [Bacillota bacterium]